MDKGLLLLLFPHIWGQYQLVLKRRSTGSKELTQDMDIPDSVLMSLLMSNIHKCDIAHIL